MFLLSFFVNPLFLVGIVTSAIPIVIHLTYRKKSQEVLFPSLRFLMVSTRRTARRKRIQELILLILRCLLLSLLAIALAKPFLRTSGPLGSQAPTSVALIVDNSYSMNARHGNTTRLELAKQGAERVLSGLKEGRGRAGLFPAGTPPDLPGFDLTGRLQDVRAALGSLTITHARADLAGALKRAVKSLDESGDANRELYIFTDMQKAGFKEALAGLEGLNKRTLVACVVPVCPERVRNSAVIELKIHSRGNLAGTPFTFEAAVQNYDPQALEVPVELTVDGERIASRSVKIGGSGVANVTFSHTFGEPGWHDGFVSVSGDALSDDDKRYFSVEVRKVLPVLVVETASSQLDFQNASYYLMRALDPFGLASAPSAATGSGIQPTRMAPDKVATEDLSRYKVIFLLNPAKPSPDVVARLKEFVMAGGGLVIFPGQATRGPELTAALGTTAGDGLLPAEVGDRFGDPADHEKFNRVQNFSLEHPILAPFKGMDRSSFTSIHVFAGFDLGLPRQGTAQALMELDGDRVFLCQARLGSGEVYLFCTAADTTWTNFPVRQVFLPMTHFLCHYLAGAAGESARYLAGKINLRVSDKEDFEGAFFSPGAVEPKAISAPAGAAVEIDAETPGVYQIKWTAPRASNRSLAVNVDASESDPEVVSESQLRRAFAFSDSFFLAADLSDLDNVLVRIREGIQLWNLILTLVLATAVFECFFANRFGGRKKQAAGEAHGVQAGAAGSRTQGAAGD